MHTNSLNKLERGLGTSSGPNRQEKYAASPPEPVQVVRANNSLMLDSPLALPLITRFLSLRRPNSTSTPPPPPSPASPAILSHRRPVHRCSGPPAPPLLLLLLTTEQPIDEGRARGSAPAGRHALALAPVASQAMAS
jgi:hypothetical protein